MKEQTTRTPPKLRVLSAFLAVAMLLTLLPAAAFAAPAPESDFEYGASNGRAIITKYKGAGGTVEIPATLGGYPVTGIKMQAFIRMHQPEKCFDAGKHDMDRRQCICRLYGP